MSHDCPSLALSDIMHTMSPSPAPQDPVVQPRPNSATPEPVQEADIQKMRLRVEEMGLAGNDQPKISSREKELVDMVLRLTSSTQPEPGQLLRQAETIAGLTEQRNYLIQQAEDLKLRWESEKDGWARMAEALIAQRNKGGHTAAKDEELERQAISFESDNRSLREKLSDTQFRLTSLESELSKLRPLLLMQPYATTHSHPIASIPPRPKGPGRKRKPPPTVIPPPQEVTDEEMVEELAADDNGVQAQKKGSSSKDHYRRLQTNNISPSRRKGVHKPGLKVPLMTDARTEHLLLAARRIGRERAGIISGLMEREQKRREDEAALAIPRTPRRTNAAAQPHTTPRPSNHPAYVYMNSPVRQPPHGSHSATLPVLIPAYHLMPRTPGASTSTSTPLTRKTQQQSKDLQNPPTPLDSLLSAARSMMDDDSSRPSANGKTRQSSAIDVPESPVPKRRKTAASSSAASGSGASVGRVKSALDVLADQAAVFSSNEGKGKEKAVDPPRKGSTDSTNMSTRSSTAAAAGKGKGRGRGRGKLKAAAARSPSPISAAKATTGGHRAKTIKPPMKVWENGSSRPFQPISPFKGSLKPVSQWGEGDASSDRDESGDTSQPQGEPTVAPPQASTSTSTTAQTTEPASHNSGKVDIDVVQEQDLPPSPPPPLTETSSSSAPIPQQTPTPPLPSSALSISLAPPIALSRSHSEDRVNGTHGYDPPPDPGSLRRATSIPPHRSSPLNSDINLGAHVRHETAPGDFSSGGGRHSDLDRVVGQDVSMQMGMGMLGVPTKRPRSPYVKWSKEEDDLLAQAVAKYGQKWDLVQKALPSRGYHQVRQRWLRKLGVFDAKPDLSTFQTSNYPSNSGDTNGSTNAAATTPIPKPKLGMAPLSSELAYLGFSGLPSGSGDIGV